MTICFPRLLEDRHKRIPLYFTYCYINILSFPTSHFFPTRRCLFVSRGHDIDIDNLLRTLEIIILAFFLEIMERDTHRFCCCTQYRTQLNDSLRVRLGLNKNINKINLT